MDLTLNIVKPDGGNEAVTLLGEMLLITEKSYRNNMLKFIKLRKTGKKYIGLRDSEMSDKIKAARDTNYEETAQLALIMQGGLNQLALMMQNEFFKEPTLGAFLEQKEPEIYASFKSYVEDIMLPALSNIANKENNHVQDDGDSHGQS